jgi:hypothetical protein
MGIIPTNARLTVITVQIGSTVVCLLALDRGTTAFMEAVGFTAAVASGAALLVEALAS